MTDKPQPDPTGPRKSVMPDEFASSLGLCGCGRPNRYICMEDPSKNACNKYGRCSSWDELYEQNKEKTEALWECHEYLHELLGCWAWKKDEPRAGNARQYEELLTAIERVEALLNPQPASSPEAEPTTEESDHDHKPVSEL